METVTEVKARLADLVKLMIEREIKCPEIDFTIKPDVENFVYVSARDIDTKFFRDDDPAQAFDEAFDYIRAMPTGQEKLERNARQATAAALEACRAAGMPDDFVNPLTAMMEKLSENAITDQRGRDMVPGVDFDF